MEWITWAFSASGGIEMIDLYRHIPTGNIYEKLYDAIQVDTKEPVIVYRSMKDGKAWVRGVIRFNERFEKVENK